MSRPTKAFKVIRNGNSFQCWHKSQYLGSISAKDLCFYVAEAEGVLIQDGKNTETSNRKWWGKNTESGKERITNP